MKTKWACCGERRSGGKSWQTEYGLEYTTKFPCNRGYSPMKMRFKYGPKSTPCESSDGFADKEISFVGLISEMDSFTSPGKFPQDNQRDS